MLNFRFSQRDIPSTTSHSHGVNLYPIETDMRRGSRSGGKELDSPTDSKHKSEVRVDVETQVVLSPKEMGSYSTMVCFTLHAEETVLMTSEDEPGLDRVATER